jgi:hypothetical protein
LQESDKKHEGSNGEDRESVTESFDETYKKIAENCFRYLNYSSFRQVDELTFSEYNALMKAVQLKHIDKLHDIHLQAWLTMKASAKKSVGRNRVRLVFSRFEKFFDYKKVLSEFKGKDSGNDRIATVGKILSDAEDE